MEHDPHSTEREEEAPPSEFARTLEEFERGDQPSQTAERAARPIRKGSKVRGKVVAISDQHVLFDVGGRSEAIADLAHFRNEDGSLKIAVGDTQSLFVVEAGDQVVLAPSVRSEARANLDRMREAHQAGMPVSGRVTGLNSGGLQVDLGGVRGFCPMSQIELGYCAEPSAYVGRTLEFLVTAVEDKRRSVVLSRRQLLQQQRKEEGQRRLESLKPGDELEGTVRRLEAFGAFVDLGGIDGMVHVSEIQHARAAHPRDVLREGEKVRVRVLRIQAGKDGRPRIALSIRASAPDPWSRIQERLAPGMRVRGTVARLADFGAFVTLEPGIDGLVHVSEIATHRVEHPKDLLSAGQEVEAVILAVDPVKKRISLSIRGAKDAGEPEPEPRSRPEPKEAHRGGEEPTAMAIAFRKAAERARQKQGRRHRPKG